MEISDFSISVVERFKQIDEIEAIYQKVNEHGIWIIVFTNNNHYDDRLMDQLIKTECQLMDLYPNVKQSYRYVASVLVDSHSTFVSPDMETIFKR